MKVENKKIILTGAGAGIGKELTKILLNRGAEIFALDINLENLESLKAELNSDKLHIYQIDMSNEKEIVNFSKQYFIENEFVDGIINNAGIIQPFVNIDVLTDEQINRVMDVNFFGPLRLIRLFLPEMKKRPIGHIVNVSSMAGFFPFPGQGIYGASKAALKMLTESLYAELYDTGIHVSIVFPGSIATDIIKNSGVEYRETSSEEGSSWKAMPVDKAAREIANGIERGEFQMYVGNDSKMMNVLYRLNPKKAILKVKKMMSQEN